MRQTVVGGVLLAVAAALLVVLGDALGLDVEQVALLGAALGAALGLVPDRSPIARIGGFLVGVAAAWIGYGLRAGFLPDSSGGRAVAVLLVVGICLAVAAGTLTRIPLWGLLLGVAAVVGAYEESYTAAPTQFLDDSVSPITSVVLAAAIGFLAASILGPVIEERRAAEAGRRGDADPYPSDDVDADQVGRHAADERHGDTSLNDILDERQEQHR